MFKKFFNWIKSIFNKITQMKLKEFRMEKGIYYVPEDFHTNPKYKVYDQLNNCTEYVNNNKFYTFVMKSELNRNIIRLGIIIIPTVIYKISKRLIVK